MTVREMLINKGFQQGIEQGTERGFKQGICHVAVNMLQSGVADEQVCQLDIHG